MEKIKLHRNIPLLFIIRICRAITINLIWTTWPLFVQSLGATVYETSLVWSLSALIGIVLAIPLSMFSDRFGRKTAILLGLAFIIIPNFAYTFITGWGQLIPFRMMANLTNLLYMPAEAAMIADISVSATRGRMFGIVGVAHPIGSIVAPLLGGIILDAYGWNAVFYAIVLAAVLAIIPSLLLTETRGRTVTVTKPREERKRFSLTKVVSRIDLIFLTPLIIFAVFNFFRGISMGMSQVTPIYLDERFRATSFQQGLFFSVGTMVPFLFVQLLGGWLADKYSRRKIILVSTALWPFLMVFWPSMASYEHLLLLQMVLTVTRFSMPAVQAYLQDFTDPARRALAVGIINIGMTMGGAVVATTLLGYLYEQYGQAIPFYAAGVFILPAIPVFMLLKTPKNAKG